jgi:hypothetical protein
MIRTSQERKGQKSKLRDKKQLVSKKNGTRRVDIEMKLGKQALDIERSIILKC